MSYKVFARKWRPQVFEEVIGQEHITETLKNALLSDRLAHAYLFSGTRGVGKTSVARIFAKALNCQDRQDGNPCNKCHKCIEITNGSSVDVQEIDGASNRGIDEIRNLRENIRYLPSSGTYRIYIIDEVHMLTLPAFNALLKTLEEPPEHTITMSKV
ncbi:MAG: DNA polymerase III subunit gamma/tau [Deltaproteobacteria bacterium]|nr:DNA polymerase III subunit gamma/tau [Deltaproteobacteria bacterium]